MKTKPKIYVASSWRCPNHETIVDHLRSKDISVYDYRKPPDRPPLKDLDLNINEGNKQAFITTQYNLEAIKSCNLMIALAPPGASTNCEMGYALARNIPVILITPEPIRADAFHTHILIVPSIQNLDFTDSHVLLKNHTKIPYRFSTIPF